MIFMDVKFFYKYSCGCGFVTLDEEKAVEHVRETAHSMDTIGSVRPIGKGRHLI